MPSERDLAQDLGVSRSIVREALRELQVQGFVACGRGRQGTIVTMPSYPNIVRRLVEFLTSDTAPLAEMYELRMGLEVQVAGLAAARHSLEDMAEIDTALSAMAVPAGSPRHRSELDLAFHVAVAKAAHNVLTMEVITELGRLLQEHRPALLDTLHVDTGVSSELLSQHRNIAAAIRAKDIDAARAAMTVHLSWSAGYVTNRHAGRGEPQE